MSYCWPHYGAQLHLNRKQSKPLLYLLPKDLLSVAFRVEQYFRHGGIFQDVLRVSASHGELSLDPCRNGDIHKLPHATTCMLLEGCPCWAWRLPYFGGHWAIGPPPSSGTTELFLQALKTKSCMFHSLFPDQCLGEFGPQWASQELHFCSPEEALTGPLQPSHRNSSMKQQTSTHQRMPGDLCVPRSLSPRSHLAETQCFLLCTLAQEQSWVRTLKPAKNVL